MPWARRLVTGLSPQTPGFHHGPVRVSNVLDLRRAEVFPPSTSAVPCHNLVSEARILCRAGRRRSCGVQSGSETGLSPNTNFFSFCRCLPIDFPYSSSYRIYRDVKGIKCRDVPVKAVLFAEFLFFGFKLFISTQFFADVCIGGEVCCRGDWLTILYVLYLVALLLCRFDVLLMAHLR